MHRLAEHRDRYEPGQVGDKQIGVDTIVHQRTIRHAIDTGNLFAGIARDADDSIGTPNR